MTCEKCGQELQVGEWPFCPHGMKGGYSNHRDDIPGGLTVENYGPHPITFYSHTERRRYMKEHGLTEKEKFCPMPGTDKDPQGIPNPAGYVDPQTLENARILIGRNGLKSKPFDGVEAGVLKGLEAGVMTQEEAESRGYIPRST